MSGVEKEPKHFDHGEHGGHGDLEEAREFYTTKGTKFFLPLWSL
jgi:hypothetical protein